MIWYKLWLETRWRFLAGLALLACAAAVVVLTYPQIVDLLPLASTIELGGEIGRRVTEEVELQRSYGGTSGRSGSGRRRCRWERSSPSCSERAA